MKISKAKKSVATKVKATSKTAVMPNNATPAKVVASRTSCDIATSELVSAPWNPRGEITPESVADLAASIATMGIIEPVIVMRGSGNKYIIVAGHRRVKAALVAGLKTVPCDILDIDEAQARRMTFIENLQRKDADPLLESELVSNLIADGMTQEEIAAETGRDRKWVARRANLAKLSPSWRSRIAKGEQFTVDCLEHIAAYPADIQEKLKSERKGWVGTRHWTDFEYQFRRETRDLSDVPFETDQCRACPHNTGCTPDLFDWTGNKPADLGKCLDRKCYNKHIDAYAKELTKKYGADGATVYRHEPSYDVDAQSRRDAKHTELYIYTDYNKDLKIEWGKPKKKGKSSKLSKKEIAERQTTRERNKAIRKLAAICADNGRLAKRLRDLYAGTPAPFMYSFAFAGLSNSWRFCGMKSDAQTLARSALSGHIPQPPEHWYTIVADEICKELDPKGHGEYNARLILALFPGLAGEMTEEECNLIIGSTNTDALINPTIEWEDDCNQSKATNPATVVADVGDENDIDDVRDDSETEGDEE